MSIHNDTHSDMNRIALMRVIACALVLLSFYHLLILSSHTHISFPRDRSAISPNKHFSGDTLLKENEQSRERCPECELISLEGCKLHSPSVLFTFQSDLLGASLLFPVTQHKTLFAAKHDSRAPPSS